MKPTLLNELWVDISTRQAADTLAKAKKRRYLEPFMRKACTLQEAADELQVQLNTMHYQVQRLLKLDLLKIVELKKRKGMTSKVYRSSALKYFVSLKHTSLLNSEDLLFSLEEQHLRTIIKRTLQLRVSHEDEWGLAFSLAKDGKIAIEFVPKEQKEVKWPYSEEASGSLINDYQTLQLSLADAQEFAKLLRKIGDNADKKESLEGKHYLIHLAMVPLED